LLRQVVAFWQGDWHISLAHTHTPLTNHGDS
jgi:hypothetical protein